LLVEFCNHFVPKNSGRILRRLKDAGARPMIVHPAPLLGFPEPLQMAASVDAVVVVALAGQTHRKSLGLTVNTLKRLRANVVGVPNEIKPVSENSYYHYSPKSYRHYGRLEAN